MNVIQTELPGVLILEPQVFGDARGYFLESHNVRRFRDAGINVDFVQDNLARSERGVLRGLHLQNRMIQGKLVLALDGEIFDVAVDVRIGSPTYGKWVSAILSAENHRQLWIPAGFAHGYCVLSEHSLIAYKATDYYAPANEVTIAWNDPALAIDWPVTAPKLSTKDTAGLRLAQIDPARLPRFAP